MFFFLSKILAFLIAPYTWIFAGLLYLLKKSWHTPFRKIVLIITIGLYLCSNSFLTDELVRAWEVTDDDIYMKDTHYDLAIVLGGMGRVDERQQRFDFGWSGDRLFQTLELYKKGRVKQIMITGGSGSISHPEQLEALYIRKYLLNIGVPDSSIIVEYQSKNTHENALYSKQLLDKRHFKGSILLVTSSFHMRRTMACFAKEGFINITPYVTNKFTGKRKFEWDYCFIPNVEALSSLGLVLHETVGYLTYKVKGYV